MEYEKYIELLFENNYKIWTIIQEQLPLKFIKRNETFVYKSNDMELCVTQNERNVYEIKSCHLITGITLKELEFNGVVIHKENIEIDNFPIKHKYDNEFRMISYHYELLDEKCNDIVSFEFIHVLNGNYYSLKIRNYTNRDNLKLNFEHFLKLLK